MRRLRLLRHPGCLVIGHGYPVAARVSDEGLRSWTCRRCGKQRYKPPPDFLDGASGVVGG